LVDNFCVAADSHAVNRPNPALSSTASCTRIAHPERSSANHCSSAENSTPSIHTRTLLAPGSKRSMRINCVLAVSLTMVTRDGCAFRTSTAKTISVVERCNCAILDRPVLYLTRPLKTSAAIQLTAVVQTLFAAPRRNCYSNSNPLLPIVFSRPSEASAAVTCTAS